MNPFAAWTDVLLKSGKAALDSLQESNRARPKVAVLPTPDAPQPRAPQKPRKPQAKAKAKAKAAPKRKARARSARASGRRR